MLLPYNSTVQWDFIFEMRKLKYYSFLHIAFNLIRIRRNFLKFLYTKKKRKKFLRNKDQITTLDTDLQTISSFWETTKRLYICSVRFIWFSLLSPSSSSPHSFSKLVYNFIIFFLKYFGNACLAAKFSFCAFLKFTFFFLHFFIIRLVSR